MKMYLTDFKHGRLIGAIGTLLFWDFNTESQLANRIRATKFIGLDVMLQKQWTTPGEPSAR